MNRHPRPGCHPPSLPRDSSYGFQCCWDPHREHMGRNHAPSPSQLASAPSYLLLGAVWIHRYYTPSFCFLEHFPHRPFSSSSSSSSFSHHKRHPSGRQYCGCLPARSSPPSLRHRWQMETIGRRRWAQSRMRACASMRSCWYCWHDLRSKRLQCQQSPPPTANDALMLMTMAL